MCTPFFPPSQVEVQTAPTSCQNCGIFWEFELLIHKCSVSESELLKFSCCRILNLLMLHNPRWTWHPLCHSHTAQRLSGAACGWISPDQALNQLGKIPTMRVRTACASVVHWSSYLAYLKVLIFFTRRKYRPRSFILTNSDLWGLLNRTSRSKTTTTKNQQKLKPRFAMGSIYAYVWYPIYWTRPRLDVCYPLKIKLPYYISKRFMTQIKKWISMNQRARNGIQIVTV